MKLISRKHVAVYTPRELKHAQFRGQSPNTPVAVHTPRELKPLWNDLRKELLGRGSQTA